MLKVLTVDAILFGLLVFSGILGNLLVIYVVYQSALETPSHHLPPSSAILMNLSLANLLTTVFRTVPIFLSDLGLQITLELGWCRVFMLLWVWWRAVSCWATLALSTFHFVTLRRQQVAMGSLAQQQERRRVWVALGLVWGGNFVLSLPAVVYTNHVHDNATVELMVISSTTRPLLGCTWEFPTEVQGVAFASASLAINEVTPLLLMIGTNLGTLHALAKHIRSITSAGISGHMDSDRHMSTERKAGHVIMALVTLFVGCWVMQVAAVTYYNHNRGQHAEALVTVSQFSASLFMGFSPLVVALGHGKLRKKIQSTIFRRLKRKTTPDGTGVEKTVSSIQENKGKQGGV